MTQEMSVAERAEAVALEIAKGEEADHRADCSLSEAEEHYKAAGRHLEELKKEKPAGVSWAKYIKECCGINQQRADQLIRIACGKTTLEEIRAGAAERMKRLRARQEVEEAAAARKAEEALKEAEEAARRDTGSTSPPSRDGETEGEGADADDGEGEGGDGAGTGRRVSPQGRRCPWEEISVEPSTSISLQAVGSRTAGHVGRQL